MSKQATLSTLLHGVLCVWVQNRVNKLPAEHAAHAAGFLCMLAYFINSPGTLAANYLITITAASVRPREQCTLSCTKSHPTHTNKWDMLFFEKNCRIQTNKKIYCGL
jgi:hypothetical protein